MKKSTYLVGRSSWLLLLIVTIVAFQNCTGNLSVERAPSSIGAVTGAPTGIANRFNATLASTNSALICPIGYSYQNGVCVPTAEGSAWGAAFGVMYTTLQCPYAEDNTNGNSVFDTSIGQFGAFGTWNWKSRPADGYYCVGRRDDVLRKHAIELRDAGIKFVYIDASNHPSSDPAYADRPDEMIKQPFQEILKVWSQIPGAPRVVPFVPVTAIPSPMADWLMGQLAQYPQMALIEEGKPFFLVAANPALPIDQNHLAALAQSYSYRKIWQPNTPGFTPDSWSCTSWCSDMNGFKASGGTNACNQYVTNNNGVESVTISPAYKSYIFSTPSQATPRYGGLTFTQQFATAYKSPNVKYALIADWNSWVAIDFCMTANGILTTDASQCPNPNSHQFVDVYTDELSRDMEPTVSQGDYYYRLMKSCIAKFQRGQPCDPSSAGEVASIGFGSGLTDEVARACTYPSEGNAPWGQSGQISGNIDGIVVSNGRALLTGWTCVVGSNSPTNFHVYLGGPAGGGGTFLAQFTTDQNAEAAVHSACQNDASVPNRFAVDVTDWMTQNPGKRIYVHGINPQNGQNYFIGQSGRCAVPWPETVGATVQPTPVPAGSKCLIVQASCPNYPGAVGTFEDTWGEQNTGAGSNPAACMQRGADYYGWCGIPAGSGSTTTAQFVTNGQVQQSAVVGNCQITQSSCPNYPNVVGTFEDTWGDLNTGASVNPAACMQRASDYYGWCGSPKGSGTTAQFYSGGHVAQSVTVGASYVMAAVTSNDALWPAANAIDGNAGSVYTSNYFASANNDRGTFLAAWLQGRQAVSQVILTARVQNGAVLGFATNYDVYLTASDNSRWNYVGNFNAAAGAGGVAKISLGSSYQTYGVLIIPRVLGVDDNGAHFFQLAEITLAP